MTENESFWMKIADDLWAKDTTLSGQTGNHDLDEDGYMARILEIGHMLELQPGMSILDIGGGPGKIAEWLAEGTKWNLIDFSAKEIELAKKNTGRYENISCELADWLTYQPAKQFDRILMASTLQYFYSGDEDEPIKDVEDEKRIHISSQTILALHKVYTSLKPGGVAIFTQVPAKRFKREIDDPQHVVNHIQWFDIMELFHLMEMMGFKNVTVTRPLHFIKSAWYMFNVKGVK